MYYGYLFIEVNGRYHPAVDLPRVDDVRTFVLANLATYPEIRITDSHDSLVLQALHGEIVFPKPGSTFANYQ